LRDPAQLLRGHGRQDLQALRSFDSLVHDLVDLAFREFGHVRNTAPPFGGRPAAEWVRELKRWKAEVEAMNQPKPAEVNGE